MRSYTCLLVKFGCGQFGMLFDACGALRDLIACGVKNLAEAECMADAAARNVLWCYSWDLQPPHFFCFVF
jgi:hypothetical protein